MRRFDDDVLGVAGPLVGVPDDLGADREPGHAVAHRRHHAGEVAALAGRERRRPPLRPLALAYPRLARVDGRRADLDQHPPRPGYRPRFLDDLQHVDPAVPLESDYLWHATSVPRRAGRRQRTPLPGIADPTGRRPPVRLGGWVGREQGSHVGDGRADVAADGLAKQRQPGAQLGAGGRPVDQTAAGQRLPQRMA